MLTTVWQLDYETFLRYPWSVKRKLWHNLTI